MSAEYFWISRIRTHTTKELQHGLTLGGHSRDTLSVFDDLVKGLADTHSWDSADISVYVTSRYGNMGVVYILRLDNHVCT